jgi:hypothetical protein
MNDIVQFKGERQRMHTLQDVRYVQLERLNRQFPLRKTSGVMIMDEF